MSYIGPSWAVAPDDQKTNNNPSSQPDESSSSSSSSLSHSSSSPSSLWSLMEIKSGVEVARHDLSSRPYTLIGRDADMCHVVLQHESCSRLHARIAFDGSSNTPWLRDLQSTHGTTVNKRKLPAAACGKLEESASCRKPGARGVVLYPSDVIQFGASTRLYCLQGPDEFARGAQQLLQKQREANTKSLLLINNSVGGTDTGRRRISSNIDDDPAVTSDTSSVATGLKQQKQEKDEDSGVSWGIDMDDHHDADSQSDEPPASLLLDESKIPEKHRKEWDRLRALRYKLENLKEESSRILRKGDLTQGQERQLSRNQEREASLQLDIQEKEQVLYRKVFPDRHPAATASSSFSQRQSRYAADEDEVEDRTEDEARRIQEGLLVASGDDDRPNNTNGHDDVAEDEQSLRAKRSLLLEKRRAILARLAHAQETSSVLKARIHRFQQQAAAGGEVEDHDGEECFFVQNDLDIANDTLFKAQKEHAAVNKLLAQTERLLKIVNPKIDFNEMQASISINSTSLATTTTTITTTAPSTKATADPDPTADDLMPAPSALMPAPPPPPRYAKKREEQPLDRDETNSSDSLAVEAKGSHVAETISLPPLAPPMMPPPKRPRVLGPSMPPPPSMSTEASDSAQVDHKRQRPRGSTLDVLSLSSSSSSSSHVPKTLKPNAGTLSKTTTTSSSNSDCKPSSVVALTMDDDENHDQWVKPKDQDGSGMTKLNQKFAGRY